MSWLIRWGLDEPESHFMVLFDDKIVFHSGLKGTHIDWFESCVKDYEVSRVFAPKFELTLGQEEDLYQDIISNEINKSYDFLGFLFFAYRGILRKFFNIPMPKRNPWNGDGLLCTELAESISMHVFNLFGIRLFQGGGLSIVSPTQLGNMMSQSEYLAQYLYLKSNNTFILRGL